MISAHGKLKTSDFQGALPECKKGLELAKTLGAKEMIGVFTETIGEIYLQLGDYPKALDFCRQALHINRENGDKQQERNTLCNIGQVYRKTGDQTQALDFFQQALKLDRESGDKKRERELLGDIARIQMDLGDNSKALDSFQRALALDRAAGDRRGQWFALENIGKIHTSLGDYPKALEFHRQALTLAGEIGERKAEGTTLMNMGVAYNSSRDYPHALDSFRQALKAARDIGNKQGEGDSLGNLGVAYDNLGDKTKALHYYKKSLAVLREIGDKNREEDLLKGIADAADSLGDPKAADYKKQAKRARQSRAAAPATRLPKPPARQDAYLSLEPPPGWKDITSSRPGSEVTLALKGAGASFFVLTNVSWFDGDYEVDREFLAEVLSGINSRVNANFRSPSSSATEVHFDNGIAARYIIASQNEKPAVTLALLRYRGNSLLATLGGDLTAERTLRQLLGAITLEPIGKSNPDLAGGPQSADLSLLFNASGEKYYRNEFKEARTLIEQALSIAKAGGRRAAEAFLLQRLGYIEKALGNRDATLAHYNEAARIYREIGDKSGERDMLFMKGQYWKSDFDPASALGFYYEALRMTRAMNGNAAEILSGIGNVHGSLGDHAKALEYYNQALSEERGGISGLLNDMARQYLLIGDHAKALEYSGKALEKARREENRASEADNQYLMGEVYRSLGEYSKAREHFRLRIGFDTHRNKSSEILEREIGRTYLAEGKMEEAFALLVSKNQGDNLDLGTFHLRSGELLKAREQFSYAVAYNREWNRREDLIAGLIGLGLSFEEGDDILYAIGLPSRGPSNPGKARAAYEEAVAAIERQRQLLPQASRTRFLSGKTESFPRLDAYEGRVRTAESAAQAFYWSENGKARGFIETLVGRLSEGAAEIPPELRKAERAQTDLIAGLYRDLDAAFLRKDAVRNKELETGLAKANEEQAEFVSQLRRDYPAYAAVQYPQPLQAGEVALKPGEVLLEYEVTDTKTILLILNSDKSVVSLTLPIRRKELLDLVRGARRRFDSPTPEFLSGPFDTAPWAKLYALLLAPALEPVQGRLLVPKGAKLIIVPDEALGLLPFEALVTRPAGSSGSPGFVGDDYDVAYAQSATALTLGRTLRKADSAARGLLVLADPIFGRFDPRWKHEEALGSLVALGGGAQAQSEMYRFMGVKGTTGESPFGRLTETGTLAADLARAFGKDAASLTGKEASEARLMEEDLSRFRYIVFATHGILDTDLASIREPALVLSQYSNAMDEDGFLTTSEVMGLKLKTEVVALTACKTGLGRQIGGEGVMGLGRAFQYAGARNVLVSLWSVAEESTTKLTKSFFNHLKAGKTPREALKLARAELRKDKRHDHPFFWAPFILMGE